MVYHNDLFGTNIPLPTLLQAVQQSSMDFLSHDSVQLHDFEGLRERCGCLIAVEQEKKYHSHGFITVCYQRSTVSFAHYTVKEYLQSPRISQKKVGFFALSQEIIQKQFVGIALRQALAIQPGSLAGYDLWENRDRIHDLLDTDFMLYCGLSSAAQLSIWPEALSSDPNLMRLSEALVNPYKPAKLDFRELLGVADKCGYICGTRRLLFNGKFWNINWRKDPHPDLAIFLSFLLAPGNPDKLHLARAFAMTHPMQTALTQQLHIEESMLGAFHYEVFENIKFLGSIPEMIAQLAFELRNAFTFILCLISEHGVTHFDLSTLLLFYISSHQHGNCIKSCSLETLLCLGASANGPEGAFVTPLQVAVECWDLHGVEKLLNAGADPNALGSNGTGWDPGSFMERFNCLHGVSSLHIITHFECRYKGDYQYDLGRDGTVRGSIETRLLESGAVDIATNLEPGSHDISDGSTE